MEWRRHGVIWQPAGNLGWARSHASCPTPLQRRDGSWRVFLQCRDDRGVGRIGWIDLDPDDPQVPAYAVYEYLGWLLSQVVDALGSDLPPPSADTTGL